MLLTRFKTFYIIIKVIKIFNLSQNYDKFMSFYLKRYFTKTKIQQQLTLTQFLFKVKYCLNYLNKLSIILHNYKQLHKYVSISKNIIYKNKIIKASQQFDLFPKLLANNSNVQRLH